ncbi:hypothetical protein [Nocardioides solisilvae]|uniref:hypothetical protein n=1 Tax=Nocardioides solisilvae TaxID=1542435 RepID=UPI000D746CFF|nr:hypothetical protein [Nocardioides solisilvae]
MSGDGLVRVPRLATTSATMWVSMVCGVLAVPGVLVWAWLTQARSDAVIGTAGCLLLVLVLVPLVARGHALDTARGELVRILASRPVRRVPWAGAEVATLHNGGGAVQLRVRPPGRAATYLPLAAADLGGERSQDPGFLRLLADEVERWGGHEGVAAVLRAQAEHVAAGGPVLASPLARLHLRHAV